MEWDPRPPQPRCVFGSGHAAAARWGGHNRAHNRAHNGGQPSGQHTIKCKHNVQGIPYIYLHYVHTANIGQGRAL